MIEGDLDNLDTEGITTRSEPPEGLRHWITWSWPPQQTVCLELQPETIDLVCARLLPNVVEQAQALQMAQRGHLVFGAYEWFEFGWLADDVACLVPHLQRDEMISSPKRTPDEWKP